MDTCLKAMLDPSATLSGNWRTTVVDLFLSATASNPDSEAVRDNQQVLTYGDLERASRALALELRRSSVLDGDVVGLWGERGSGLAVAMLGTLRARAVFAVLDASYPAARLADAISLVSPKILLRLEGTPELPPEVVAAAGKIPGSVAPLTVSANTLAAAPPSELQAGPECGDPAYILFTSGTTGLPKAILTPHAPLPHFVDWYHRTFEVTHRDRVSVLSGLSHDPVLRDLFVPLSIGGAAVFPTPSIFRDPAAMRSWLATERVTVSHMTPALAQLLLEGRRETEQLPTLRLICLGGAILRWRDVARLRSLAPNADIVNFYGTSETPQAVGYHRIGRAEMLPTEEHALAEGVPLGRGIDDVQLLVINSQRKLANPGEEGELFVRTPYLSRGYIGREDETRTRYVNNPFNGQSESGDRLYRTGDRASYRDDGAVEYRGRIDDQVKIRGFRVEPAEVEAVILRAPGVARAAVLGYDPGDGESQLAAFVVVNTDSPAEEAKLRAFLRASVPDYMVPGVLRLIDAIPLTQNGKVDRASLRRMLAEPTVSPVSGKPGSTPTEEVLLQLWRRLLGNMALGADDSFFDVGGHSLLALRMLTEVETLFGKRVPMQKLLEAPTVASLGARIDSGEGLSSNVLVRLRDGANRPPLIWLPGGGGLSVLAFRTISSLLGDEHPVYGVEVPVDAPEHKSAVEARAADYVRELRGQQLQGAPFLLGFSLGAWVAFEMARQLEALGASVGLLVVFDTHCAPKHLQRPWKRAAIMAERYWYHARRLAALPATEQLQYVRGAWNTLSGKLNEARIQRRYEEEHTASPECRSAAMLKVDDIDKANRRALREYALSFSPPPIRSPMLLVLAERTSYAGVSPNRDPRLAWRKFTTGPVEVVRVPGSHLSMLEPPHVERLAVTLRTEIARARSRLTAVEPRSSST